MHRFNTRRVQLLSVALTCLAIGAGASAVATADATNTTAKTTHTRHATQRTGLAGLRAVARRTVSGSLVVATRSGFVTVTIARGLVQAVSGQTLTLVEGTKTQTYRTVNLSLPATVRVRDNGTLSTLSQVTAGQRATVVIGANRALVVAHTPSP